MDKSIQCPDDENTRRKISIKLSKDSNNQNWLVNDCHAVECNVNNRKKSVKPVSKKAQKKRKSLKVSIPIGVFQTMREHQKQELKMPNLNRILPPPPMPPAAGALPFYPSALRTIRHHVPTSTARIMLADKHDQITKPPESPKIIQETFPQILVKTPPLTKEMEIDKTVARSPASPLKIIYEPSLFNNSLESQIVVKQHKLPPTVVKEIYSKKPSNPINKENEKTSTQTITEVATQTEMVFMVTEEEHEILALVKNSGLTKEELKDHLDNFKKEEEKDHHVIDLSEDNTNDVLEKVFLQSTKNKYVLNNYFKTMQPFDDLSDKTPKPITATPSGLSPSSALVQQFPSAAIGIPADTLKTLVHHTTADDILKGFTLIALLQQAGFRLIRSPQLNVQETQTEDKNDNTCTRKRRISPATKPKTAKNTNETVVSQNNRHSPIGCVRPPQELQRPALVQQLQSPQSPPMFQPPNLPRLPTPQQYIPESAQETPVYYPPNIRGAIPHQRAQYDSMRHQLNRVLAQQAYEQNRSAILSAPQTAVQMPSPVQMYPTDPRRPALQHQVQFTGLPHLSRVLSTHEANMHGPEVQQTNCWGPTQSTHYGQWLQDNVYY